MTKRTKQNIKLSAQKNSKKMNRILQKIDLLIEKAEEVFVYVGPGRGLTAEEFQAEQDIQDEYEQWVTEELSKYDNGEDYDPNIETVVQQRGYVLYEDEEKVSN